MYLETTDQRKYILRLEVAVGRRQCSVDCSHVGRKGEIKQENDLLTLLPWRQSGTSLRVSKWYVVAMPTRQEIQVRPIPGGSEEKAKLRVLERTPVRSGIQEPGMSPSTSH